MSRRGPCGNAARHAGRGDAYDADHGGKKQHPAEVPGLLGPGAGAVSQRPLRLWQDDPGPDAAGWETGAGPDPGPARLLPAAPVAGLGSPAAGRRPADAGGGAVAGPVYPHPHQSPAALCGAVPGRAAGLPDGLSLCRTDDGAGARRPALWPGGHPPAVPAGGRGRHRFRGQRHFKGVHRLSPGCGRHGPEHGRGHALRPGHCVPVLSGGLPLFRDGHLSPLRPAYPPLSAGDGPVRHLQPGDGPGGQRRPPRRGAAGLAPAEHHHAPV